MVPTDDNFQAKPIEALALRSAGRSPLIDVALHPPTNVTTEYRLERYLVLLPFSSGAVDLRIDGAPLRRTRMRVGAITFVEPARTLTLCQVEPVELLAITIDPNHLRQYADRAAQGRAWIATTLVDVLDSGAAGLGQEVRRALLSDPLVAPAYLQALVDALIARLLCRFLGEAERVHKGEALSPGTLGRVVRHIDERLEQLLRVEDLAVLTGLSRSHFSRAFQRMTGDTPGQFILKRRLCRARDLISSGESPLAEIAARTGFSSQAHLSTAFRKELGTTPGSYRLSFKTTDTTRP